MSGEIKTVTVVLLSMLALTVTGFWLALSGIAPGAINMGLGVGLALVLGGPFALWAAWPIRTASHPGRPDRWRHPAFGQRPPPMRPHPPKPGIPKEPEIRFTRPAETMIEPRDESDPFCTCPACGLLGNHLVEVETFRERTVPGRDGEPVAIPLPEDPPDGTLRARRTCVFCGHVWHTPCTREGETR